VGKMIFVSEGQVGQGEVEEKKFADGHVEVGHIEGFCCEFLLKYKYINISKPMKRNPIIPYKIFSF